MPHAPVLLQGLAGDEVAAAAARVRAALGDLDLAPADVIVMLSPHGRCSGVYAELRGSLDSFGVPGVVLDRAPDEEISAELARTWGRPLLRDRVDHGVLVPLLAGEWAQVPVVAATVLDGGGGEAAGPNGVIAEADAFAHAMLIVARRRSVAFVASANTSAALSPRAPLGERPEAVALEDGLLEALRLDAGVLQRLAPNLPAAAGSCGAGPLRALGRLLDGTPLRVLAYERPVGVGYLVARSRP